MGGWMEARIDGWMDGSMNRSIDRSIDLGRRCRTRSHKIIYLVSNE